jgi:SAM-dependent methyltransferase
MARNVQIPALPVHGTRAQSVGHEFYLKSAHLDSRLPWLRDGSKRLLDVGCGSGVFTIGAARLGYRDLGFSWDERNRSVAKERALMCKAPFAEFEVLDVRNLDKRLDLKREPNLRTVRPLLARISHIHPSTGGGSRSGCALGQRQ